MLILPRILLLILFFASPCLFSHFRLWVFMINFLGLSLDFKVETAVFNIILERLA